MSHKHNPPSRMSRGLVFAEAQALPCFGSRVTHAKTKPRLMEAGFCFKKNPGDDLLRVALRAKKHPQRLSAGVGIKTLAMTYSCMA